MAKKHRIQCFDEKHEPALRDLYQMACCNGEPILKAVGDIEEALKHPDLMRRFFREAHVGFARAQDRIVERLVLLEKQPANKEDKFLPEEMLLRKLADSIAWQMLRGQLYIARRLCSDQRSSPLTTSNYSATLAVAHQLMGPDHDKAALMADITTFIHTTDLVVFDSSSGELSFAEVKQGEKNHQYLEALNAMVKTPSFEQLDQFYATEGKHGIEQLMRMAKQAQKMSQVSQILNTGSGFDPHLKATVRIPDEPFIHADWNERLRDLIENSKHRGWAIDAIDEVLYLGAYRGHMARVGGAVFHAWFNVSVGRKDFPVLNLMQCMEIPLALPVFSRHLHPEAIFDLLFGRCKVYVGVDIDALMRMVEKLGASARWASRKETAKFRSGSHAVKVDNRAIVCEMEGTSTVIGDGLLARMVFHGVSPQSIAEWIIRDLEETRTSGKGSAG